MKWAVDSRHPWRGKTQLLRTPAASGVRVDAASGVRVEGLGFGVFGSDSGLRVKGLGRVSPRPLEIPKRASLRDPGRRYETSALWIRSTGKL